MKNTSTDPDPYAEDRRQARAEVNVTIVFVLLCGPLFFAAWSDSL